MSVTPENVTAVTVEPMSLPLYNDGAAMPLRAAWTSRWVLMLVLLYCAAATFALQPIIDPDIWWHLRTGQWVIEHGTVPHTDPFSMYGADRPWVAYSWLFGVLLYGMHALLGLMGVALYTLLGSLGVTTALLCLVLRFETRVPVALALTAAGLAAIGPTLAPRAYLFTVCFFIIEIYVLFLVRETGRLRPLWVLPPLFALWANLHVQFVHGLLVLGMAVGESLVVGLHRRETRIDRRVPFRPLLMTAAGCALATLATPYGVGLYRAVAEHSGQRVIYKYINELSSPPFRGPAEWVFLALALGAAFSLGRQRRVEPFPLLLLAGAAYFSFLAWRDAWFLTVVSVAIIAMTWGERRQPRRRLSWAGAVVTAVGVAVGVGIILGARTLSTATFEAAVATVYPAGATEAIRQGKYPGPLFNDFNWGGYLIWRLPEYRVSMDGRANLHGDDRVQRSVDTWTGRSWESDEELRSARLVIASSKGILAQFLSRDARFKTVYRDDVASVFTRDAETLDLGADDRRPSRLGTINE